MPRTLASDPQKAAPLFPPFALAAALVVVAAATHATPDAATSAPVAPSVPTLNGALGQLSPFLSVLLPLACLLRFVDVLLVSRDETLSENALRALEMAAGAWRVGYRGVVTAPSGS